MTVHVFVHVIHVCLCTCACVVQARAVRAELRRLVPDIHEVIDRAYADRERARGAGAG